FLKPQLPPEQQQSSPLGFLKPQLPPKEQSSQPGLRKPQHPKELLLSIQYWDLISPKKIPGYIFINGTWVKETTTTRKPTKLPTWALNFTQRQPGFIFINGTWVPKHTLPATSTKPPSWAISFTKSQPGLILVNGERVPETTIVKSPRPTYIPTDDMKNIIISILGRIRGMILLPNSYEWFGCKQCEAKNIANTVRSFLSILNIIIKPCRVDYECLHIGSETCGYLPNYEDIGKICLLGRRKSSHHIDVIVRHHHKRIQRPKSHAHIIHRHHQHNAHVMPFNIGPVMPQGYQVPPSNIQRIPHRHGPPSNIQRIPHQHGSPSNIQRIPHQHGPPSNIQRIPHQHGPTSNIQRIPHQHGPTSNIQRIPHQHGPPSNIQGIPHQHGPPSFGRGTQPLQQLNLSPQYQQYQARNYRNFYNQ
ncbi:hypothetical protein Anas_04340, partial [Armadillidium nasatum]